MFFLSLLCLFASCQSRRAVGSKSGHTSRSYDGSMKLRRFQTFLLSYGAQHAATTAHARRVSTSFPLMRERKEFDYPKKAELFTDTTKQSIEKQLLQNNIAAGGLVISALVGGILLDFQSYYMDVLASSPVATKAATAGAIAIMGDALAQYNSITKKLLCFPNDQCLTDDSVSLVINEFDFRRSFSFAVFGAAYTGAFQHELYPWLIGHCDGNLLRSLASNLGLPYDQHLLAAAESTLANQLGCIPLLYYPIYFAITGALTGLDADASVLRAKSLYLPLLKRNLAFWIPVQFYQFSSIPVELQVPFVCVAGLIWNIILSASANAAGPAESAAETAESPLDNAVSIGDSATAESASVPTMQLRQKDPALTGANTDA